MAGIPPAYLDRMLLRHPGWGRMTA